MLICFRECSSGTAKNRSSESAPSTANTNITLYENNRRYIMKKRILSFIFSIFLLLSMMVPAFALNAGDGSDVVRPTAHDVEYKRTLVSSESIDETPIGFASGQPANGTIFTSPGGFFWNDGGLFNSVDISFSVSWGIVSASVSVGSTGTTGESISAPTNTRCKLFIYKEFTVDRYANYERVRGSTGAWTFTGYEDIVTTTGHRLEVRYGDNFNQVWRG